MGRFQSETRKGNNRVCQDEAIVQHMQEVLDISGSPATPTRYHESSLRKNKVQNLHVDGQHRHDQDGVQTERHHQIDIWNSEHGRTQSNPNSARH